MHRHSRPVAKPAGERAPISRRSGTSHCARSLSRRRIEKHLPCPWTPAQDHASSLQPNRAQQEAQERLRTSVGRATAYEHPLPIRTGPAVSGETFPALLRQVENRAHRPRSRHRGILLELDGASAHGKSGPDVDEFRVQRTNHVYTRFLGHGGLRRGGSRSRGGIRQT